MAISKRDKTMNIRRIKATTFSVIFLIGVFAGVARETTAAVLKPGEIVYSRAVTVEGGNCATASIWAVGQDGLNDRFVTNGLHPRISPDGRYLLFKRFNPSSLCSPFQISPIWWMRELATDRETQIAINFQSSSGHFFSPQTNRGANQIVESDGAGLCRMNLDGTNRICTNIPNWDPIRGGGHPSVRGTDNLLLVQNFLDNTDGGLYTLNYDDFGNRQKIPNTIGRDLNPSWSNDGQKIAFAAFPTNRGEPYFFTNLFKINPDGSSRTQLTSFTQPFGEGFSYSLVWTLDNSTILNAAKLNGVAGIYKISANGGGVLCTIPITPGAAPEWVGGIVPPYSEQQVAGFGGGLTSNGNFSLVSTVGQGFAGQTSTGGAFNFQSGFWALPSASRKTPFDLDGDLKTDVAIFRPGPGEWWYSRSSDGGNRAFQFGSTTDKIVPADYTGDGKTDVAFFRPSTGQWFVLRSEDSSFFGFPFGNSTDVPVPADYDGDGKADAAVFRESNLTWYINKSSGGTQIVGFGAAGDLQVPGDFDGDGKADIAFWRPSTGFWNILRSEDLSYFAFPFGTTGDVPIPGDYDGDGKFDAGVFRPSNLTWFIQRSTAGTLIQQFGTTGDVPLPNAYVR